MPIVEVENLKVVYNKTIAVDGISFNIEPGETVGFLGSNGAGKSSTLKVLGGVLSHTSGSVRIAGHSMDDYHSADLARSVTGYCPDVGGLIPQATLREHIGLSLSFHRRTDLMAQALEMVDIFDLGHVLDKAVAGYSHGMSRRASVILAAISSHSLLILDEPFDGVDPEGVSAVQKVIDMAKNSGVAVIVSTHLQKELTESTDEIIVMSQAKIVDRLPAVELQGEIGKQRYANLLKSIDTKATND
ncbi:MAG: ABC transporter ATP-binding protein [Enterococcus sp.]|nr:ABC transporter ATP-binding protein [Enterococcus sp.]